MKLDPAGVEKAARAMKALYLEGHTPLDAATAALTAYFDHLRESGKAKEARGFRPVGRSPDCWVAGTTYNPTSVNFPALIIKQEE